MPPQRHIEECITRLDNRASYSTGPAPEAIDNTTGIMLAERIRDMHPWDANTLPPEWNVQLPPKESRGTLAGSAATLYTASIDSSAPPQPSALAGSMSAASIGIVGGGGELGVPRIESAPDVTEGEVRAAVARRVAVCVARWGWGLRGAGRTEERDMTHVMWLWSPSLFTRRCGSALSHPRSPSRLHRRCLHACCLHTCPDRSLGPSSLPECLAEGRGGGAERGQRAEGGDAHGGEEEEGEEEEEGGGGRGQGAR